MSTLNEQIQEKLADLVAGGAWYGWNPTAPEPRFPYITWQRIPSPVNNTLEGPSDLQNTRVQIDIYSRDAKEVVTISRAIAARFAAWSVQNVQLSSQDIPEPEIRAFRTSEDWSLWSRD